MTLARSRRAARYLVGVATSGFLQAASAPRTTLVQTLQIALAVELVDGAGWKSLIALAEAWIRTIWWKASATRWIAKPNIWPGAALVRHADTGNGRAHVMPMQ